MALIECKECGKEISSSADACPNCGKLLSGSGWLRRIFGAIIIGFLLFFGGRFLLLFFAGFLRVPQPQEQSSNAQSTPDQYLAVDKHSRYEPPGYKDGYCHVYGSVKNVGDVPLTYWEIQGRFHNKKGEIIDTAMANSIDVLPPNASKKFEIGSKDDGQTSKVDFVVNEVRRKGDYIPLKKEAE